MTPGSRNVIILVMWLKFYFWKMLASTKLWFLKAPSFLFSKSAINYLSNKWSTVSIRHVGQNLWTFPFLTKNIEIMTSLYKMLTSLRKRFYRRNFGMVLYIKSYLTLKKKFSFLSTSLRILRMGGASVDPPNYLISKKPKVKPGYLWMIWILEISWFLNSTCVKLPVIKIWTSWKIFSIMNP